MTIAVEAKNRPLPAGWTWESLDQLSQPPQYGYTTSAQTSGSVRFLRITDITDSGVDWSTVPYCVCAADDLKRYGIVPGDILFARIGATTGKSFLVGDAPPAVFASYLIRIRPNELVVPEYLSFFFQSEAYWAQVNARKDTNLKKGVSATTLAQLAIAVPPPGEQLRIASVLGFLRAAVATESELVDRQTELKRALIDRLFTHGLRAEAQKDLQFGSVPESWAERQLSSVAEVQTGAAKGRKFEDDDAVEVPYLRVANVQDGHLDLAEMKSLRIRKSEIARYRLRKDDVVLTEGGDFDKLGRGFIWRDELPLCVHQNHVFAVRTNADVLLPDFFAYLAQSPYGKAYFLQVAHKTTNLACINSTKLKAFPVVLPEPSEQRGIVEVLAAIDKKLDIHGKKRVVLEQLFQSLLHKLMTGELAVSSLDLSAFEATS